MHTDATQADVLFQAVRDLGTARDVPAVTDIVRKAARRLTGADGITVVLREDDQCHYVDEEAISPLWKGQRFPMAACVSGWVMQRGVAAVIPDIYADARIPQDAYRSTFVRSLAMMPVRAPSAAIAAIGAYWARPHTATSGELEVLHRLAENTGLALENIRLRSALDAERRARADAETALRRQPEIETELKSAAANARELAERQDEFMATLAHELRQPIHAAAAALQVIEGRGEGPARDRAREVLARQLQQMTRLVEDLMDASRIVRGEVSLRKTPVDLRDVVQFAVDTAGAAIQERQHELETNVPDAPVLVDADALRLQQVLVNLLSNAAKYTPRKGRIRLHVEPDGGTVSIRVRDNGAGIPPDALPRIFDAFVRVNRGDEAGFGIGLAVARKLVEQHDGSIEARSDGAGRGAEFIVRLPIQAAPHRSL